MFQPASPAPRGTLIALALLALVAPAVTHAQEAQPEAAPAAEEAEPTPEQRLAALKEQFGFEPGPLDAKVGAISTLKVPAGWLYTGAPGAKSFLEATQNIPDGDELAVLLDNQNSNNVWVMFSFDESGYVKDDDKDDLDADEMLEGFVKGTEQANEIHRSRGESTLTITGWLQVPRYDEASHNLEWALKAVSSTGGEVVNYNVRVLGRKGMMEVALIASPDELTAELPRLREILKNFAFTESENYAAFTQGDKIAEYGLAGVVGGGALVVAAKSGLLAKFWKLILVGIAAVGGGLKKLFGGKKNGEQA